MPGKGRELTKRISIIMAVAYLFFMVVIRLTEDLPKSRSAATDTEMVGIERLHELDAAATLSRDPTAIADLWTDDAVRLEPGGAAEIGRQMIRVNNEKSNLNHPGFKILSYTPEIKSVEVSDGWAFEWGYFSASFQEAPNGPAKTLRGKLLRVLRKQNDGSWKFARVMWNLAN